MRKDVSPWGPTMQAAISTKELVLRALTGGSVDVSGVDYSLHDLTQIALALKPEAHLAVRDAGSMTPLERASIASVGTGRVVFL